MLWHDCYTAPHVFPPARLDSQHRRYISEEGLRTLFCIVYHRKGNTELNELVDGVPPTYLLAATHFTDRLEWDSSKNLGARQLPTL